MTTTNCYCVVNARDNNLYYDLVNAGKLILNSSTTEDYEEKALLTCNQCGRKWHYRYNDSYHSPIVEWQSR